MLEKTYEFSQIESEIESKWQKANAFAAGAASSKSAGAGNSESAEPYCIVIPPPNVTGSLHMGHALNNTLQDILIRYHRMQGKNVLWQPGMDHAGIATQMVVERQLEKNNEPTRRELGREKFIEKVWQWKEKSGGTIFSQLKKLGASCDWQRERFTMDEGLSKAVLEVFVTLHKQGLIYRDKRLVNWDPVLQTAISDLEVENKEQKGQMWSFAYPLVEGEIDGVKEIVISTTRPETMLGDGAVAVHPSDKRYKNLIGKMVRLPIAERHIPIIADEYPDPEFGTGAVKITGAHDFNDFEVARRHNIPLIALMDGEAKMISTPENNVPKHYAGLDRYKARELVLKEIEALGFFRGVEEKPISQPFGDRSGVVVEPMLTDQWYVDAKKLAKPAIESVRKGRVNFVPKHWEKTYFDWMENIQAWCISRQLWWGHRIPAWYGPDGKVFVEKTKEQAQEAANKHYGKQVELTQDEDVLDTWFSSALWPFSTLGWPEQTKELKTYYQTDVLVTGFDIIFFWVARMMMMGIHFMQQEPFHTVYVHALVRDKYGAKMSKSKGNVIDPVELIEKYGADALRFTLAIMAAQGRDVKLAEDRVAGYRNFGTKLWNATRFLEMHQVEGEEKNFNPTETKYQFNRWILTELSQTIVEVQQGIESYKFNEAAFRSYRFIWNQFCDWYIELLKPVFFGEDENAKKEARQTARYVLDEIYKFLHPFMPFMTEHLWQATKIGRESFRKNLLCHTKWPRPVLEDKKSAAEINWLIAVISEVRSMRTEMNIKPGQELPLIITSENQNIKARLEAMESLLVKLGKFQWVKWGEQPSEESVHIILDDCQLFLPLKDIVDFAAERTRLNKKLAGLDSDAAKINKNLENEQFVKNAPPHIIDENRSKLAEIKAKAGQVKQSLARLG